MRQIIPGFTNRPHHIRKLVLRPSLAPNRHNLMPALIQRRPNQVIHRRIHNLENLRLPPLLINHLRQQHPRIAHHEATRLQQNPQSQIFQQRHHRIRIRLNRQRMTLIALQTPPILTARIQTLLVNNPDPSPDTEELQPILGLNLLHQRLHLLHRLHKRPHRRQLRPNVHLQTPNLQIRTLLRYDLIHLFDPIKIDPKLVLTLPRRDLRMRFRIHIRIHPYRHRRLQPHLPRDLINEAQLRLRLRIETVNPFLQSILNLIPRLAHPRKRAHRRLPTRPQHTEQLTARHNVKSTPKLRNRAQHRQIRVRLHRIANHVVQPRKPLIQTRVVIDDRLLRVNIQRRAMLFSQRLQINVLSVQRALEVAEMVHKRRADYIP